MSTDDWSRVTRNGFYPAHRLAGGLEKNPQDPELDQVVRARSWLVEFAEQRKTINRSFSSYTLKHSAERGTNGYISNGAMIQALLLEGYRLERTDPGSPNAYANVRVRRRDL